ncbi:protein kinase, cAMP-dependent, catalytic, beta [Reticulomyxa filosa]|uniref:Protein kinase, cAMP-dependent, catalytic, beta n=1 Tax=Reticulomyxa filosa TaxID=46433 RepID=X6NLT9_RETFI|nr:protein kinase, cAMP-dependent, catalytic, beta [Reticulomyxa filosa]|eukprot:ETO26951.1 protein kinase, cAMP-dependent, catalytic, beta [Reticulomyxa filosa]
MTRKIDTEYDGSDLDKAQRASFLHWCAAKQESVNLDSSIELKYLQKRKILGTGSFGQVHLVKHTTSNEYYALKMVYKATVVQLAQQDHILNEKTVLTCLNSPFIIRLISTFQDTDSVYFLLEPVIGGELFVILRRCKRFNEKSAQFYSACVGKKINKMFFFEAFEHMHSKSIVYRDLKPENLLIDQKGYLKITDLGFAKFVYDKTYTLCGTPDYLAPELISGKGHDRAVDWWTLGILIYEMIASFPPFYAKTRIQTYDHIIKDRCVFPAHFTTSVCSLIRKLLHKNPPKGWVLSKEQQTMFDNIDGLKILIGKNFVN